MKFQFKSGDRNLKFTEDQEDLLADIFIICMRVEENGYNEEYLLGLVKESWECMEKNDRDKLHEFIAEVAKKKAKRMLKER